MAKKNKPRADFPVVYKAYNMFRKGCENEGLCVWDVPESSRSPYRVGITLDAPIDSHENVMNIGKVKEIADEIATHYNLEDLVNGPIFSAGGAYAMYVGFK